MSVRDLIADLLDGDSPLVRQDSPLVRHDETRANTEDSPLSPLSPGGGPANQVRAYRWHVFTSTNTPREVWLSPPGTADDAMFGIDDAIAAEPDRWLSVGCATCMHLAQPGLAEPGYCGQRTDLPHAYGPGHPLHLLPDDRGATCQQWERIE